MSQATQLDSATHFGVAAQFQKLAEVRDGWLNGVGRAPAARDLEWLADQFATTFPEGLSVPFVCLTPEGGVFLEWSQPGWIVSVEVPLPERRAELQATNIRSSESIDEECSLDDASGLAAVYTFVQRFV